MGAKFVQNGADYTLVKHSFSFICTKSDLTKIRAKSRLHKNSHYSSKFRSRMQMSKSILFGTWPTCLLQLLLLKFYPPLLILSVCSLIHQSNLLRKRWLLGFCGILNSHWCCNLAALNWVFKLLGGRVEFPIRVTWNGSKILNTFARVNSWILMIFCGNPKKYFLKYAIFFWKH